METELNALEQKIGQLVDLCQRLRTENTQMRQQLAVAINENKQLLEKINGAQRRLESLLVTLPESKE